MKITLIAPLPPIKAVSPYCLNLARELARKVDLQVIGFKSLIPNVFYTGRPQEKEKQFLGLQYAEINNIITWYNPVSWIFAGIKTKGDIVHFQHWASYSSFFYCIIVPILKIRQKKLIFTIHNITPHVKGKTTVFIDRLLNKFLFRFTHIFIVHNERNKEKFIQLYSIKKEKIFITTHGILSPEKILGISQKNAREILGISKQKKVLLFFGYFWKYKGLDTLLYSMQIIKKKIPEITCLIVGQPLKGQGEWKLYENIIKENNLQNNIVTCLKFIPESDIELYFSAADIVVLPYKEPFDTHGGVAAIAIVFKKPILVTDIGGLPQYVKDISVISKPDDIDSLAHNIIRVLTDESLCKKLSEESGELAEELTWDRIVDKTISIYNTLL